MSRYRVTFTVVYDVEVNGAHSEIARCAESELDKILGDKTVLRKQVRLEKLKEKRHAMHLGEFKPDDVLPFISRTPLKQTYIVGDKAYQVRMDSQRYFIFRESVACAACGIVGTKMILEQFPADKHPHFNLYAIENGRLLLMTKDHVQPKAFGGEDRHSNYQTMCASCNNLKGSSNFTLEGIAELRKIYNSNRSLSKKKLRILLEQAKKRLAKDFTFPRITKTERRKYMAERKSHETLSLNTDLCLWRLSDNSIIGRSIYETPLDGAVAIACIKLGTELKPCSSQESKVVFPLGEESFTVYHGYLDFKDQEGYIVIDDQAVS